MASYTRGRNAFLVGVLAIASIVTFGGLFGIMTNRSVQQRRTEIAVSIESAPGLVKGDAVLFRGVAVGDVRSLDFGEDGRVLVRVLLTRPVPITTSSFAVLTPVDMFGRQSLVLDADAMDGRPVEAGDTLDGISPPGLTGRLDQLTIQARRLLGDTTVEGIHTLLEGGNETAREIRSAAQGFDALMRRADRELANETARLDDVLRNTARLSANLGAVTDSTEMEDIRENLEVSTANLRELTARLDTVSQTLNSILVTLDRGQGSMGLALHDPRLYENAASAMARLDRLLADIRENPGRYVRIRIF
jgi:phospholipid/cholesterol/gamma-HCH transport system substrate-binding protein